MAKASRSCFLYHDFWHWPATHDGGCLSRQLSAGRVKGSFCSLASCYRRSAAQDVCCVRVAALRHSESANSFGRGLAPVGAYSDVDLLQPTSSGAVWHPKVRPRQRPHR